MSNLKISFMELYKHYEIFMQRYKNTVMVLHVLWIHTSKWTQTKEDFDFISHVLFIKKYI